jgi:mono/diheme cytochrome c family protein
MSRFIILFATIVMLDFVPLKTQAAEDVTRGKYLVSVAGCNDCHTPGYFFGKPDDSRYLGGSDVGFEIPGAGIFHGPNLTPDKETGLGSWSDAQIVTALTTGKRPDGRELAGVMPWRAFANFTPADLKAIVAYLRTLPPVHNKAPGPYSSTEQSAAFVMKIVPGGQKK